MQNAKSESLSPERSIHHQHTTGGLDLGFGQVARHGATLLACLAGMLSIANLWLLPLNEGSLLAAGRGVVLLLLAIGLMGTSRLSLFLTLIVALGGLTNSGTGAGDLDVITVLEVCLAASAAMALLSPRTRR